MTESFLAYSGFNFWSKIDSITSRVKVVVAIVWGRTYITNIKSLEILQKRTNRVIHFAKFDAHTNPLFAHLKLIKLQNIIFLYTACFIYHFSKSNLPNAFTIFSLQFTQGTNIIPV